MRCIVPLLQGNGYRFMFLSSRAIAQASTTRDYLQRLNQDGHRLPAGDITQSVTHKRGAQLWT